ncbi:uncharacterized protein LOC113470244 isoform X2 [Diaphorina citri]|uniref:Uncharacterized protein LOC113470244 isoform X1 n=1 Tax=Diaphorina citri TaxID=121845 RepID=A0A3Q0J784_DIACI|nr:uncharacterized protein LOC113470244 isoform X1 [Diaphorina citri]XP_026684329.1 uncharacterized protein LOC113470244 isoform X2 [Diaphorina citri]
MNISEDNNNAPPKSKKNAEIVSSDSLSSKTKILIPISNFNLINLFSSSKDAPLKFNYIINNANISANDLLCLNTNEEEPSGSQGAGTEETTPPVTAKAGKKGGAVQEKVEETGGGGGGGGGGGNKLIVGKWFVCIPLFLTLLLTIICFSDT